MEITGRVKVVWPQQQVSASFVKRELVITTEEQYPQSIMIEFVQDKVDLVDKLQPGDLVTVSINLGGREWVNPQGETKYFNSIKGWRVQKTGSAQAPEPAAAGYTSTTGQTYTEEEHDNLPF